MDQLVLGGAEKSNRPAHSRSRLPRRRFIARGLGAIGLATITAARFRSARAAAAERSLRLGLLQFGTVRWEVNVIVNRRLDRAERVTAEILPLSGESGPKIALEAGEANLIVSDWFLVARQRATGDALSFFPYSRAVGSLLVPTASPIRTLGDLAGRRLGIAGGALDKSWLILRAYAIRTIGRDLAELVEPVYAAPPLLNEEIVSGRIDAVLNYWHYAARLEARGFRVLSSVQDAAAGLGLSKDVPMLGYVFKGAWASENRAVLLGFARASLAAKRILATDDAEWDRLRPLIKAEDETVFQALRDAYRLGIPQRWGERERSDAARLFSILAELGGADLVGPARHLPDGTFWPDVTF